MVAVLDQTDPPLVSMVARGRMLGRSLCGATYSMQSVGRHKDNAQRRHTELMVHLPHDGVLSPFVLSIIASAVFKLIVIMRFREWERMAASQPIREQVTDEPYRPKLGDRAHDAPMKRPFVWIKHPACAGP